MKISKYTIQFLAIFICSYLSSCEEFVDVGAPDHKIASELVFNQDETAISAMIGIYNQLFRVKFSQGGRESVTVLAGVSSDELMPFTEANLTRLEFEEHKINPDNSSNLSLWSSAYKMIYMTNSLLEGIKNSNKLTEEVSFRLEGEAKFIRAFTYFYLVNIYGEVPLLLTSNYAKNALASRNSEKEVYQQIIADLQDATTLLHPSYIDGERTYVNRYTAFALLARVYLYLQEWREAEKYSSLIINRTDLYSLLKDLDKVYLANSKEAIWQISPIGSGSSSSYTYEGNTFIIHPTFPAFSTVKLKRDFINDFATNDYRLSHWIGYHEGVNSYYPYKYKDRNSINNITEYSMVIRLAELYLIRSEARAMQGNLSGAIEDIDKIRDRSGIKLIENIQPSIDSEALLDSIIKERKRELFSEWGHRWFDLKRTGRATKVLGINNSSWQEADALFPIPEDERMKNPNLDQNIGY